MKILVVGMNFAEGFARFITDEFQAMGHEAALFDPQTRTTYKKSRPGTTLGKISRHVSGLLQGRDFYRKIFERSLFGTIDALGGVDLIVVCSDFLYPKTVAELKRRTRAPVALWYPDAIVNFGRHAFINAPYDALFFKDPYVVEALSLKLPLPVYYLPECYSPRSLYPLPLNEADEQKYSCDIATAGNMYAYRIAFMQELKEYNVKLWGNAPPNWALYDDIEPMIQNEYVSGLEKAKAFRGARIVLNNLFPAEIWGLNVRAFEIAGAGGFQMIDWRPGLSQLFVDGREIVSFKDRADLKRKIVRYLAADDERAEIAAAGQRRAAAEHTYQHRLQLLLDTMLKADVSGYPIPKIGWEDKEDEYD